jgi:hypothetical protein
MKQLKFWLIIITFFGPLIALAHESEDQDCIKLFKVQMDISQAGVVSIKEELQVWVGTQPSDHAPKIQKGIVRTIPSRGGNATTSEHLIIESVERDGVAVPFECYDVGSDTVIKIQGHDFLLEHQEYDYVIKYRYPGMMFLDNDLLLIDWQMTLGKGLPVAKAIIDITLPDEASLKNYRLKTSAQYLHAESSESLFWQPEKAHGLQISAQPDTHLLHVTIESPKPSDTPVCLEMRFSHPQIYQSLSQKFLNKMQHREPINQRIPIFAHWAQQSFVVTSVMAIITYFYAIFVLKRRQTAYDTIYQKHLRHSTYQALSGWQKQYLASQKMDKQTLQILLHEWYDKKLATFEVQSNDALLISVTEQQRHKMSQEDRALAAVLLSDAGELETGVWEKKINASNKIQSFGVFSKMIELFNSLGFKKYEGEIEFYIGIVLAGLTFIISIPFMARLCVQQSTYHTGLYIAALSLLVGHMLLPASPNNRPRMSGLSLLSLVIMLGLSYDIMYNHDKNPMIASLFVGALYAYLFEIGLLIYPVLLELTALEHIARRFAPKKQEVFDDKWQATWSQLKNNISDYPAYNHAAHITPYYYRVISHRTQATRITMPAAARVSSGGGSAGGC